MDCNFSIKVSMLTDGELSPEESETVKRHLADCEECQKLEKDFLFFREQIKESADEKNYQIPVFPTEKQVPFWKKAIPIPAPVIAGLLLAMVGFGIWFLAVKSTQTKQNKPITKTENQPDDKSLAGFDKGGRAEIYVVSREQK